MAQAQRYRQAIVKLTKAGRDPAPYKRRVDALIRELNDEARDERVK